MKFNYWLLVISLTLSSDLIASNQKNQEETINNGEQSQIHQSISQAILRFEQTARTDWSYSISRFEDEEGEISSSLEQFNPAAETGKQWSLLRINGELPSKKQTQKFAKSKDKESKNQHNFSLKLRELIQIESLQLVSEDEKVLQLSFNVYLEQLGHEKSKKLKGRLSYSKAHQFIERIEITNVADISPIFSANITKFTLTLEFIKIEAAVLPKQHNLEMEGTFAFFTDIKEVSKDTFSNYQYVGQSSY